MSNSTLTEAQRLEAWAGEARVNLIRVVALIGFYGYHLVNVSLAHDDATYPPDYRSAVTAVVLGWAGLVTVVYAILRQGRVPDALPYLVTIADAALVTALVVVSGGPKTPLVQLYLLVVAAAPLRLSLPGVYCATLSAVAGYVVALGHFVFIRVGTATYYADATVRIPRTQEVITILSLLTAGFLAGQVVRQAQRLSAAAGREAAS